MVLHTITRDVSSLHLGKCKELLSFPAGDLLVISFVCMSRTRRQSCEFTFYF